MKNVGIAVGLNTIKSYRKEYILNSGSEEVRFLPKCFNRNRYFAENNICCIIPEGKKSCIKGFSAPFLNGNGLYNRLIPSAVKRVAKFYGNHNCPIAVVSAQITENVAMLVQELLQNFRYVCLVTEDNRAKTLAGTIESQTGALMEVEKSFPNARIGVYISGEGITVPQSTIVFDPYKQQPAVVGGIHINNFVIDVPVTLPSDVETLAIGESIDLCTGKKHDYYIKDFLFNERSVNLFDIS